MHVSSVIVGFAGVISFLIAVFGNAESVLGITKGDALACAAVLVLIAIWLAIGTIHHMALEQKEEII